MENAVAWLWSSLQYQFEHHPVHLVLEFLFVAFILYLLPQRSFRPSTKNPDQLTKEERDELIDLWEPKPLIPHDERVQKFDMKVVEGSCGERIVVNGKHAVNFASYNFLGFLGDEDINRACSTALHTYGVGACGPRGFYGTIDVHLRQEQLLARFMGTQEAILYSYDFATISSVIPAFLKRDDVIVVDECANHAVKTGAMLSRSRVLFFRHNDMQHLEELLKQVTAPSKSKKPLNRRFIVVEGLYQNSGDLCPLPDIVRLKNKYKFRLAMDDSFGIGTLGRTGRGTCEHFGIDVDEVDIITGSLSNSFAAVGGFCVGSHVVVDHQRLSGTGYVFSAALPPYLSAAGIAAMNKLMDRPEIIQQLEKNTQTLREELANLEEHGLVVSGDANSPLIHLRLKRSRGSRDADYDLLETFVSKALDRGIALTTAKYTPLESHPPPPSIRMCVSVKHTPNDLSEAANVVKQLARELVA